MLAAHTIDSYSCKAVKKWLAPPSRKSVTPNNSEDGGHDHRPPADRVVSNSGRGAWGESGIHSEGFIPNPIQLPPIGSAMEFQEQPPQPIAHQVTHL
jgi:hypothetical protein